MDLIERLEQEAERDENEYGLAYELLREAAAALRAAQEERVAATDALVAALHISQAEAAKLRELLTDVRNYFGPNRDGFASGPLCKRIDAALSHE